MPLRSPNNPLTEAVLLPALTSIVHGTPPNTQMALNSASGTAAEVTYSNSAYALSLGAFPALHLTSGERSVAQNSPASYTGSTLVHLVYFDRYDEQSMSIDTLREQMRVDLLRMQANIETYVQDNEGIVVAGVTYPLTLTKAVFAGYDAALNMSFPGFVLATRTLDCTFGILPYAV